MVQLGLEDLVLMELEGFEEFREESENLHEKGVQISKEINDEGTQIINETGLVEDRFCKVELEYSLQLSEKIADILEYRKRRCLILEE